MGDHVHFNCFTVTVHYLRVSCTCDCLPPADGAWTSAEGQRALQAQVSAVVDGYRAADLLAARTLQKRRQLELAERENAGGDGAGFIDMPGTAHQVRCCCSIAGRALVLLQHVDPRSCDDVVLTHDTLHCRSTQAAAASSTWPRSPPWRRPSAGCTPGRTAAQ